MLNNPAKYLRLQSGDDPPAIGDLEPFKAIVLIEEEVSQIWQWETSRWLVLSGCRFMMAWGTDCGAWAESVDEALLEAFNYDDVPQDRSVVTTSHEDEELSEVFWFAKHRARHPVHELKNMVIVHISEKDKGESLLAEWLEQDHDPGAMPQGPGRKQ
jgi:hypothetical protein